MIGALSLFGVALIVAGSIAVAMLGKQGEGPQAKRRDGAEEMIRCRGIIVSDAKQLSDDMKEAARRFRTTSRAVSDDSAPEDSRGGMERIHIAHTSVGDWIGREFSPVNPPMNFGRETRFA